MAEIETSAKRRDAESHRTTRSRGLADSPPLFDAPVLDRLTRVHHLVPPALYGPVIVALYAWGIDGGLNAITAIGWAAGGYAFWTLTEYWLHRVVFHFEPEGGIGRRLHYLVHGVHHDHPSDPRRLVMPPSASVPLAIGFCVLFRVVLGTPEWRALASGFLLGYLVYDMVHYLLHHRVPRGRVGRALRERHMRHHFQDDTRGFGVSAPYWDVVFGTAVMGRRQAAEAEARAALEAVDAGRRARWRRALATLEPFAHWRG